LHGKEQDVSSTREIHSLHLKWRELPGLILKGAGGLLGYCCREVEDQGAQGAGAGPVLKSMEENDPGPAGGKVCSEGSMKT